MRRVVTFGTYDLLHIGHLNILRRARAMGDRLIVGVSSDALTRSKKGKRPVYPLDQRLALVAAVRHVDEVFVEHSLERKAEYLREHRADVLVMGDDWAGRFDHLREICDVVYLPRTEGISSTEVKAQIRAATDAQVRATIGGPAARAPLAAAGGVATPRLATDRGPDGT
jgi:glycerol-3-phosphate cytidylyltransferase